MIFQVLYIKCYIWLLNSLKAVIAGFPEETQCKCYLQVRQSLMNNVVLSPLENINGSIKILKLVFLETRYLYSLKSNR